MHLMFNGKSLFIIQSRLIRIFLCSICSTLHPGIFITFSHIVSIRFTIVSIQIIRFLESFPFLCRIKIRIHYSRRQTGQWSFPFHMPISFEYSPYIFIITGIILGFCAKIHRSVEIIVKSRILWIIVGIRPVTGIISDHPPPHIHIVVVTFQSGIITGLDTSVRCHSDF